MRILGTPFLLLCLVAALAACAQPYVYTEPYVTVAPASLNPPLNVSLEVDYTKDGKRDPKRDQALAAALGSAFLSGGAFRVTDAASAGGKLVITLDDQAQEAASCMFCHLWVMVSHALIAQQQFTPEGKRSVRNLSVGIRYTPAGGKPVDQTYLTELVTVTQNTLEPTDLVPLQDRTLPELALIENDVNAFAAGL